MRSKCLTIVTLLCTAVLAQPLQAEGTAATSARDVMLEMHQKRAAWENFPGFTADVAILNDSARQEGSITVDTSCEHQLLISAGRVDRDVEAKLKSLISHRRAEPFEEIGYAFVESGSANDGSRLIEKQDGSGIFRVRDGVITDVIRKSENQWLEIANLKTEWNAEGRYLPSVSSVTYRNPKTGDLESQRSNTFEWIRVGSFDLPKRSVTVEVKSGGHRSVREIIFTNHKLTESLSASAANVARVALHRPLPEALTSFGAAINGDYLYVFSGHNGDAHGFGRDQLANHFRRIRFDDANAEWEQLAMHSPAQSTALLTDGQFIYRIGGLSFRNSGENSKSDFDSTNHFARYDMAKNEWTDLQPLPEGRSSLDAAILDGSIYVAGGWNLQGESSSDAPWHETILKYELSKPESGWQTLPGPGYKTRALSVAAHKGKIYLLGGIQDRGITRQVAIYDPGANTWTAGPELRPDSRSAGFATSSFSIGGHLYYTGDSGIVYRLSDDEKSWDVTDRLMFPRMFLRLLPVGEDRLIALGGTSSGSGNSPIVESLRVTRSADNAATTKTLTWSVPFEGRARHSQTLALKGMKLYAVGGNASDAPHDFSKEAFVNESFVFDLARRTVTRLPELPIAMQSGSAIVKANNSEHSTLLVTGGMGFVNDQFSALDMAMEFDEAAGSWRICEPRLGTARSMFTSTFYDDAMWMFGGAGVGKQGGLITDVLHWWGDDSTIAPLAGISIPTPRRSYGGAEVKGKFYLVGGLTAETGIAEQVDVFDFEARQWSTVPSPKIARVFPSVVASNGRLYLFGGFSRQDGHFAPATSLEVFDPTTSEWTTLAEKIDGVEPSMSMLSLNGRLLFFGIDRSSGKQANFVLLDPEPQAEPVIVETMSFGGAGGGTAGGRRGSAVDHKAEAKRLLRRDVNKDGLVDREEIGERMLKFFEDADQDRNEQLTFEEIVAALQKGES